jgi:hypothetical protein
MKQRELKLILDSGLVSSIRVVPIPLSNGWCVDVLIKELLISGSRTATLESDRSSVRRRQVRRFATIDSAARFLHRLGMQSFQVDMADSISFATADAGAPTRSEQAAAPALDSGHAAD